MRFSDFVIFGESPVFGDFGVSDQGEGVTLEGKPPEDIRLWFWRLGLSGDHYVLDNGRLALHWILGVTISKGEVDLNEVEDGSHSAFGLAMGLDYCVNDHLAFESQPELYHCHLHLSALYLHC